MNFSIFSVSDYYPDAHPSYEQFYKDQIDLALWAEKLGFTGYFAAEHHFHPYGLIPDPTLILTAVAMQTTKLKLGPAVAVLPFHNPLRVAEQYAMLDQLSKGRLILGVGSGYLQHEFGGFSLSPANKRAQFDETLEVMEKAITGKKFSHKGEYFNYKKVQLQIGTYENREITPKIAILSELASYYVGKRGYGIMTIPYATVDKIEDASALYNSYRKGWAESGKEGNGEVFAAIHTHVCDNPSEKNELNKHHIEKYVYSRLYAKHSDYDECLRRGVIASGTPDEVTEQIQRLINTGVDHVKLLMAYGAMPQEEVKISMERVAKEVIPNLEPAPVKA
ncbi:LLM class flavin-dependent oxidoreductase [bacterium]|nr:LLM class flavin-dependent oxidoreductase [bacterium]